MRQFKIYVPVRNAEAFIKAERIGVHNSTGQVVFYNSEDVICGVAPVEAVVVEVL